MEQQAGTAGRLAGGVPRCAKVSQAMAGTVEHVAGAVAVLRARLEAPGHQFAEGAEDPRAADAKRDRARLLVLRLLPPQGDPAAIHVDVGPLERCDFAAPPTREVAEARRVLQVTW